MIRYKMKLANHSKTYKDTQVSQKMLMIEGDLELWN